MEYLISDIFYCSDLPVIKGFLESDSVDVRVAAGECIALLFELARDLKEVSIFNI